MSNRLLFLNVAVIAEKNFIVFGFTRPWFQHMMYPRAAHLKKIALRTFLGYFVWKIMILCKKIIFFPILGGACPGCTLLGSAPGTTLEVIMLTITPLVWFSHCRWRLIVKNDSKKKANWTEYSLINLVWFGFMVFNGTFNNGSVISYGSQSYWWKKLIYPEKTTDLSQVTV